MRQSLPIPGLHSELTVNSTAGMLPVLVPQYTRPVLRTRLYTVGLQLLHTVRSSNPSRTKRNTVLGLNSLSPAIHKKSGSEEQQEHPIQFFLLLN
jgi:hypothetical protein